MIKPLKQNVIVAPIERSYETESGLYTGNYNPEHSIRKGTVVSVGDEVKELHVGDKVIYQSFTGNPLTFEDKRYLIMYETEILGTYEES